MIFYPYIKENFEKNYKALYNLVEQKSKENTEIMVVESTIYRFKTVINYNKL